MFQTFISRHNSNFFSDKLVLTSVTPASSAPVLQTPKATSATFYSQGRAKDAGQVRYVLTNQVYAARNLGDDVPEGRTVNEDPQLAICFLCQVHHGSKEGQTHDQGEY